MHLNPYTQMYLDPSVCLYQRICIYRLMDIDFGIAVSMTRLKKGENALKSYFYR